jgi:hypothetical protein
MSEKGWGEFLKRGTGWEFSLTEYLPVRFLE